MMASTFNDPFDLDDEPLDTPDASGPGAPGPGAPPARDLLEGLNPEQQAAVEALDGPVLVLAGAGTGKTRVLTTRIAHLLTTGRAYPGQILAVTFTNKAAREMKNRIEGLMGRVVEGMPWLGTFHSISAQMLRRHAEAAGLTSNFTILDTDDQIRVLKQIIEAARIDEKRWPARQLAFLLDRWKNKGWLPDHVPAEEAKRFANGKAIDLYRLYQERLKTLNAVDFGDLLLQVTTLFQHHPDILEGFQDRFRYILVDEYQDTNVAQYLWLRLLAQKRQNICCVGDDDQSIYGWRGAEVDNILRFETDFPEATVIRLERNYRSTSHILGAASGLINANKARLGKTLWTEDQAGEPVSVRGVFDHVEEARTVSDTIETLHKDGHAFKEMAVLVRASSQMRNFEDRFFNIGLPYKVIGGPRFYERQEIRDANAYFRLIVNPSDSLAFERIFNKPSRKLGDKVSQAFAALAREADISYLEASRRLVDQGALRGQQAKAMDGFLRQIELWSTLKATKPHTELAGQILDESGYMEMLMNDKSPQAPGRIDNLKDLVSGMAEFDTLAGYLEHVSLVMDREDTATDDAVTIMTLHAAKGLEFDTVFLPGWEEGMFPNQRSMDESGEKGLEEERRLAYVGLTRARKRSFVSYTTMREIYGRTQPCIPSRFITELPDDHVEADHAERLYDGGGFGAGFSGMGQGARFESTYDTPGWQRAREALSRAGGTATRPPVTIDHTPELLATNDPQAESFKVGDRIFHQKFGYGLITAVEGNKLTVEFEKAGAKKVIASFVERSG